MNNFKEKVLRLVSEIPKGKITTYKLIAAALGLRKGARAVGNALHKNEKLIRIPCHRVVRSDGSVGDYVLGEKKKAVLLRQEGVAIKNGRIVNFRKKLYTFFR